MKELTIRYTIPGKDRPRVFIGHWNKGMIEAFRELFNKIPNANPISFNGINIVKGA